MSSKFLHRGWIALGGVVFLIAGLTAGIPFDTVYRVGCAGICWVFVAKIASDYPTERWPRIALWAVLLINISLFFTPIFHRPSSRGEVMLFALPDAIALLIAKLANTTVSNDHERAQRQMVIFGLVVAIIFCTLLYSLILFSKPNR